jgi:hypothetical protein
LTKCFEETSSYDELLESCCPECTELISNTTDCFADCLPECVENTTLTYVACVSFEPYGCEASCEAALEGYIEDASNEFIEEVEDGVYEVNLESLSELDADDFTCANLEEAFSEEVCELASCCSYCIDRFEDVAECIINEVIYGQLLNQNTTCEIDCGDNAQLEITDFLPSGGKRFLQPSPGSGSGNLPPGGDLGDALLTEGAMFDIPADIPTFPLSQLLEECRRQMSASIAVGFGASAYDIYTECLMTAFYNTVPKGSEPTSSPVGSAAFIKSGKLVVGTIAAMLCLWMSL